VIKINTSGKSQKRIFLLSTAGIYNIEKSMFGYKSRRFVPCGKIQGITTSSRSNEFVLHVTNEKDYRYDFPKGKFRGNQDERKKLLLRDINIAVTNSTTKPLKVWYKAVT